MAARMQSRPRCASCNGEQTVLDLFGDERLPCDACEQTGYDLLWQPGPEIYVDTDSSDDE